MSGRPIAYVMEQTLGSITHYLNLRREESAAEGPLPRWVPIEFRAGRLPWTMTGSWLARRALRGNVGRGRRHLHAHDDAPFRSPSTLFRKKAHRSSSSDGTPLNKRGMRQAYGLKDEGPLGERVKRELYRRVFATASGFVAWSNWTKQSFVEDYGCKEQDVAVIPPGIDLKEFSIGDRNHELPRILFVGGDFERKGGDLLLDVFRRRLRGRAELILVTRAEVASEPGITVHRDVAANSPKLHELYRTSDMFVLPTRADCYSLVCMEALAAGLPIVATRVGGIPDMIQEGETGHLLDVGDSATLGDALESLITQPALRHTMGEKSRAEAERRFDARENARLLFEFVRSRC